MCLISKKPLKIFLYQIFCVTVLMFTMSNASHAKNLVYENNWAYLADTVMGGVSRGVLSFPMVL